MVEQLRELRRTYGYKVSALVSGSEGVLVDQLRAEQIPVHSAEFVFSPNQVIRMMRAIFTLAKILRANRFDVVQSHVFWTTPVARPAAWIADVPVRLAMVSSPLHLEVDASRRVDMATAWMETAIIPSCKRTLDIYRELGIAPGRLPLIYYGADPKRFHAKETPRASIRAEFGWPEDTPVVALVSWFYGRLPPSSWVPLELRNCGSKGQDDFVIAARQVLSEFPNARFVLVGGAFDDGGRQYLDYVKWLIGKMNLEEKIVLTGHRMDVNQILRDVDVAVQAPPMGENLGGTIEGLLMECPMVVTRVGGMVDSVRDGETGVLVNPNNPSDLARGILDLLREPERARRMARRGRELVLDRFTLDQTIDDLHALYSCLLRTNHRRRSWYSTLVSLYRLLLLVPVGVYAIIQLRLAWVQERWSSLSPKPQLFRDQSGLKARNIPGDIVPIQDLVHLRSDRHLPENGLFLGDGWYDLERDDRGPFRWLKTDGELVITRPDGSARGIVLELESGPGQGCRDFELQLVNERGAKVDCAIISGRREVRLRLPPLTGDGAIFRLVAPKGEAVGSDPRTLNLRVFRVTCDLSLFKDPERLRELNPIGDIGPPESIERLKWCEGVPENGLFLGRGWYDLERDERGPFRWLQSNGELVVTRPDGCARSILIDLESGPGQECRDFELQLLSEDGVKVDSAIISGRTAVMCRLPLEKTAGVIFSLVAPAGVALPDDARVLNLRVFGISWL
jgi:glycosyltransferase involved in cell wall biosynthesis